MTALDYRAAARIIARMFTITQAAAELSSQLSTPEKPRKVGVRYVRSLCVQNNIGASLSPRVRILSAADIRRLKTLVKPAGNPNFSRRKSNSDKDL